MPTLPCLSVWNSASFNEILGFLLPEREDTPMRNKLGGWRWAFSTGIFFTLPMEDFCVASTSALGIERLRHLSMKAQEYNCISTQYHKTPVYFHSKWLPPVFLGWIQWWVGVVLMGSSYTTFEESVLFTVEQQLSPILALQIMLLSASSIASARKGGCSLCYFPIPPFLENECIPPHPRNI